MMTKSEKIKKFSEIRITSVKFKIFSIQTSERLRAKIRKIKIKKIFLDSSPHRQPAQKGKGVRVENVGRIYSEGKYPVLAICVRTQIDFYRKGGITTH